LSFVDVGLNAYQYQNHKGQKVLGEERNTATPQKESSNQENQKQGGSDKVDCLEARIKDVLFLAVFYVAAILCVVAIWHGVALYFNDKSGRKSQDSCAQKVGSMPSSKMD
jgi:hypothetical protein